MTFANSANAVAAMLCIALALLSSDVPAAEKPNMVQEKTWCSGGMATLTKDVLGANYKLRKALQIRAVTAEAAWLTSCPVELISRKPNDSVCKRPSVLYDGKHDIGGGRQRNWLVILHNQGAKKYTLVIDNDDGAEIARSDDVDLSPLGASGRWAHADIGASHHLFIYYLDFYDDSSRQMGKVYYVEDFDSTDSGCTEHQPNRPGNVIDCEKEGECSNSIRAKVGKEFTADKILNVIKQEEGVGVGTEKRP